MSHIENSISGAVGLPKYGVKQRLASARELSAPQELALRFLLLACVLLELNTFLWLYTGAGNYGLDAETAAGAKYYSVLRYLVMIINLGAIVYLVDLRTVVKSIFPILAVYLFFFVTVFYSGYFADSFRSYLIFFFQLMIAVGLCIRASPEVVISRLRWIAMAIILMNLVFVIAMPVASRDPGGFGEVYSGAFRGIFPSKNVFGANIAICFSLIYFHFLSYKRNATNVIYLILSVVLIILSQSATSAAAVAVAVGISMVLKALGLIRSSESRFMVVYFSAGLALAVGALIMFAPDLFHDLTGRDLTFTGRTVLWDYVFNVNTKPFLGFGFGGFWQNQIGDTGELQAAGLWQVGQAHNGFIEAWLFGGYVGAALCICLTLYLLNKALFYCVHAPQRPETVFVITTVFITILQNTTESNFPNSYRLAGVMLALCVVMIKAMGDERRNSAASPRLRGRSRAPDSERISQS